MELTDIFKNIENIFFSLLPVSSGLLFVIVFYNSLFLSLDWVKLLMMSFSIFTPFLAFNFFLIILYKPFGNAFSDFSVSEFLPTLIFITSLSIYAGIAIRYLFPISLTADSFIILFVIIIFQYLLSIKIEKNKK